jgi:hypothetical protein
MAETQNYENHKKWSPLHHFVQMPLAFLLTVWTSYEVISTTDKSLQKIWIALTLVCFSALMMSLLTRMQYGLVLQSRIIRVEMRYRYYRLTQKFFEEVEKDLKLSQIAALRFASDEELPNLVQKAIDEKLSPDAIKRQIKNWAGDYHRV